MRGSKHMGGIRQRIESVQTKKSEYIRFNELKRIFFGISSTVLSERLFYLECEGLVTKKIHQEVPPKLDYHLTPQAKEV